VCSIYDPHTRQEGCIDLLNGESQFSLILLRHQEFRLDCGICGMEKKKKKKREEETSSSEGELHSSKCRLINHQSSARTQIVSDVLNLAGPLN
jgi:hypothetical protein